MYKKLLIYFFVLIISISIVFANPTESLKPEVLVETVFDESQAKFDHININSYVIINNEFIPIDKASKICNDISEKLGMKDINVQNEGNENYCLISANGILNEEEFATIIIQSSKIQDLKESSIVLDIIITKEQYELEKLCSIIRDVLESYGEVNLNINLAGYYDGLIDKDELEGKINRLFKLIGAKKVEGINEDGLISITGYAPNMEDYISYCGKRANINIATRYNGYEDKTYIWIGTPLIVLEY